ncbi:MAG: 16S rRNA (uracil(1498)-N(3))-methyltransferase [Clostridiales bacterium]|nr:16S rRNA (uracil(1498)-N(3))-methyltransferase [Clostridiales bacterium]
MHRFYVEQDLIRDNYISIIGSDVNHIKNVLRLRQGDEIVICNGQGKDYYCIINEVSDNEVVAAIDAVKDTAAELKSRIALFQGLPKKDKFELIIQKAVELGAAEIVPVMTGRVVVKLEDKKKEEKKLQRWQAIAMEAAKQSGRGIIPAVRPVHSFFDAIKALSRMELALIPYEKATDISITRELLGKIADYSRIGVFIGPEGGFEEEEIKLAMEHNIRPITLGRRILRTETAGLAILSMMMLMLEE